MSTANVSNDGVNEAGVFNEGFSPVSCLVVCMRRHCRDQATVQKKWSTQSNICVMTWYYQSQPCVTGYRQRLHAFWKEKWSFQVGE